MTVNCFEHLSRIIMIWTASQCGIDCVSQCSTSVSLPSLATMLPSSQRVDKNMCIIIGASLSKPHTSDNFVQWFVRRKTAVKYCLPHTTVSLVGWFKHYNTRKILNPYRSVCNTTKTVFRLLVLHIWSYGGSCHELVNGEDY